MGQRRGTSPLGRCPPSSADSPLWLAENRCDEALDERGHEQERQDDEEKRAEDGSGQALGLDGHLGRRLVRPLVPCGDGLLPHTRRKIEAEARRVEDGGELENAVGEDLGQDEPGDVEALVFRDGDEKTQDAAVEERVEDGQKEERDDARRYGDNGGAGVMIEESQCQDERRALELDVLERPEHEFQGLFFLVRPQHEIDEADDEARAEGPRGVLEILPVVLAPSVPFFGVKTFDCFKRVHL